MKGQEGLAATAASGAVSTPAQADHGRAGTGHGAENPRKFNALVAEFIG